MPPGAVGHSFLFNVTDDPPARLSVTNHVPAGYSVAASSLVGVRLIEFPHCFPACSPPPRQPSPLPPATFAFKSLKAGSISDSFLKPLELSNRDLHRVCSRCPVNVY